MRTVTFLLIFTLALSDAATAQSVRVLHGNVCGSGWRAGHDATGTYVVTNAHVAGTRLGETMDVEELLDGVTRKWTAEVVYAAYSDRSLTDFAILRISEQVNAPEYKLAKSPPTERTYKTCGSPRCVWPLVCGEIVSRALETKSAPWLWTPNSIGGQSGSAIVSPASNVAFGLLTWSWNGQGAGQQTSEMYRTVSTSILPTSTRPPGLREVADRHETSEGIHQAATVTDFPIWAGDVVPPLPPTAFDPIKVRRLIELILELLALIQSLRPPT